MPKIVIDTVSLINICKIDLHTKRIVEWLSSYESVYISETVFQEGQPYVNEWNDEEANHLYFTTVRSWVSKKGRHCMSYTQDCIDRTENAGSAIDYGERTALSLGIRLSLTEGRQVVFVTDDYKASGYIDRIFRYHSSGFVITGFDLIRFLGFSHAPEIPREAIEIALRSLSAELRDDSERSDIIQEPEQNFLDSREVLTKLQGTASNFLNCCER